MSALRELERGASPAARHRAARRGPVPPRALALAATCALALAVPLAATLDLALPGRALLAVLFTVCVPGVPLALAVGLRDRGLTAALALAAGPLWAVLAGTVAIAGGWWAPVASAWVASAVALAAVPAAWRARPVRAPARTATAPGPLAHRAAAAGALLLAAALWWSGTRHVRLDEAGALGLLPVVGWRVLAALAVLCAVTAWALTRPRPDAPVLTAAALLLAAAAYTTAAVADGYGNPPVAWVHVGFAEQITLTGTVPGGVDARFSWPGFFAAAAQLVELAGVPDARAFLVAAPVFHTALALPGLFTIARTVTRSVRWAWVGVFCHLLANWYQQDYFAPQAIAFVGYVAVLATVLRLLDAAPVPRTSGTVLARAAQAVRRVPGVPVGESPATLRRAWLLVTLIVLGITVGHQLTPVALTAQLAVAALVGLTRARLLWLVTGVTLAGWFAHGATDYWLGHLQTVVGDIGRPGASLDAGVGQRLTGDPTYQRAQLVRVASSAALFGLGGLGLLVLRRRRVALLLAGIAAAPFGLLLVQSYGGEVLIRCFLYASPVLAPLAAVALRRALAAARHRVRGRAGAAARRVPAPLALVPLLLAACLVLVFDRGLNVSFERTPPGQALAASRVYELARPGDTVGLPGGSGLTPYLRITDVGVDYLDADTCADGPTAQCVPQGPPRFLMVTSTQDRYGRLLQHRDAGWVWELAERWSASAGYVVLLRTPTAWLLERTEPVAAPAAPAAAAPAEPAAPAPAAPVAPAPAPAAPAPAEGVAP
ncbi:serine/threonine protein kinase [Kineococcus sp. SYSU DK005]|uniref:serine/threonine protein kinase n=1 Tax=Kineococcus sp. SYSU DK005 TaxID=3383126 RepID=UPI003D7F09BD